jgi:hypothetical protein
MINDIFAMLPASIRYNTNISDFAKIVWCEIYVLNFQGNKKINNETIASNLNKTKVSISRAISELKKESLLIVSGERNERLMMVSNYEIKKDVREQTTIEYNGKPAALMQFFDSFNKK